MDLNKIFTYHKPFGNQPERYEALRAKAYELARMIEDCCPDSREKSLAITNVQQSVMWANAAIAVNEVDWDSPEMIERKKQCEVHQLLSNDEAQEKIAELKAASLQRARELMDAEGKE